MNRLHRSAEAPSVTEARERWLRNEARRPVLWWAAIGVAFLAVAFYAFVGWFVSGDAFTTPTGPDPVPSATRIWAWLFQCCSLAGIVVVGIYCWRRSKREGELTFDALLVIGCVSMYWQDPGLNFLRPLFLYNSYLANLGAWTPHVPGWISPYSRNLPEPLLLIGGAYVWWPLVFAILYCAIARRAHRRWPNMNRLGVFLVGLAAMAVFDVVLEILFVRTELMAYQGTVRSLSLWGGRPYQFPLYESLFIGSVLAFFGTLRHDRDDQGRPHILRGIDRVHASARGRTCLSVLAFVGVTNVALLAYNVAFNWVGLYADQAPAYPSYLRNSMCGEGTNYPCPGKDVPVYSSHSLPD